MRSGIPDFKEAQVMKRSATLAVAAALLFGAPDLALATGKPGGNANPNSSSTFAPGQQPRTSETGPGASGHAPGHQDRATSTSPGASGSAPGHQPNPSNTGTTNPVRR
jgi:hypothetical protein